MRDRNVFFDDLCDTADEIDGEVRYLLYRDILSKSSLGAILEAREVQYLASISSEPSASRSVTVNLPSQNLIVPDMSASRLSYSLSSGHKTRKPGKRRSSSS